MTAHTAIVVSDSAIFGSVIKNSFEKEFQTVSIVADLECLDHDNQGSTVVVIVDASDMVETSRSLDRLQAATIDLSKFIMLMRPGKDSVHLIPFVGKIGALLPYSATAETILHAAKIVSAGLAVCPHSVLADWVAWPKQDESMADLSQSRLTSRETDILDHLSKGRGNKDIARQLSISESTIRVHVRSILRKLGAKNRTQAALMAVKLKIAEAAADERSNGAWPRQNHMG